MDQHLPAFNTSAQRRRFRAALAARRLVPRQLLPATIRLRSWLGRRRPGRWALAVRNARMVMGEGASQSQVEEVALATARHAAWRQEAYRRPALMNDQEVIGVEHLQAALAEGRGVLLSLFHHGDYMGSASSLARLGMPVDMITVPECFSPDAGPNVKAAVHLLMSIDGVALYDVAGGSARIRERLAAGHLVMVAIDLAGHTPTRAFGRDLLLSSGGLRVAMENDVPVIALTSQRPDRPARVGATVAASPLWPRDFPDFESLHAEAVRQLEKAVLEWPEAMHQPDRLFTEGIVR